MADALLELRAENSTIFANGSPLAIKGVSWFGLEGPNGVLGGLDLRPLDEVLNFLVAHDFNAIRLPLSARSVPTARGASSGR